MLAYWILFAVWAAGALLSNRRLRPVATDPLYIAAAVGTTLMIGLRYQVGGDWGAYQRIYDNIALLDLGQALRESDPGYALVNWISAQFGGGVWPVNLACASIFMWGITRFAARQPNPWLTMLVGVPYFIIVVAMGYTRQATAIGIVMAGLATATDRSIVRLTMYVLVGALFHKTAVLTLPLIAFPIIRRNTLMLAIGGVVFVGLYALVLRSSADAMVAAYAQSNYDSSGAAVRVAMNVAAALMMVRFRSQLGFGDYARLYWLACSGLAIVSVAALGALSASSGVDRLSLFLIPLQLAVLPRLPYVRSSEPSTAVLFSVLVYSAAVQFTWLTFANNAYYWVPYGSILSSSS